MAGDTPDAPDPYATADAQGKANVEAAKATAALNRYDTVTPFGSVTWSQDPTNPDHYINTTTLDPKVQTMLDSYLAKANTPTSNINFSALPAAGVAKDIPALDISGAPKVSATKVDTGTALSGKVADQYGNIASTVADRMKRMYSTDFNYDSLGAMPTASDATRKAVEDAYYARQAARLDPRMQQDEEALRTRLANQGIIAGSKAYEDAYDQFNRGKNDAYSSAMNDSILNSTSEMAKQFQLQMQARQQGAAELEKVRQAPALEAQAALGLYGNASNINIANLEEQSKLYERDLAAAQAARDSYIKEQQLLHSTASADQNQKFNQDNAARATALQEQLAWINNDQVDRTNSLNQLLALRSGTQVNAPGATPVQVGASPVAQSIYNSYQGQLQNAQNQAAGINGVLGTAGMLGAAAMMSPVGTFAGLAAL